MTLEKELEDMKKNLAVVKQVIFNYFFTIVFNSLN